MADAPAGVLVVGTGPAGAGAAEALREAGYDGTVVLVGREPDVPYDRTPTSKEYLRGEAERGSLALKDDGFWADRDIELRTRTMVMKLDTDAHVATLAGKQTIAYERLVLATGANVRRLRVEGGALDGVHTLRAPGNADTLRADLEGRDRVVLIGGSFIACEVAASLAAMGKACTLVAMEDSVLSNALGRTVGDFVGSRLRDRGIELALGETLSGFEGEERVATVVCESGRRLDADVVVMGTGAMPDVTVARAAGLTLGDSGGIACDGFLRTSAPDVWAAGDVCEYESTVHGRNLRVEHWEHASAQGAYAARSLLGQADGPYAEVPYFWSDLGDGLTVESVGPADGWARELVRGSVDDGEFSVFFLDEADRVVQAATVGRSDDLDQARELIVSGDPLPEA